MSAKLQNATNLYMEGIRDGNAREAVTRYTGDVYVQHSTGVRDGVEGFLEFFEGFLERTPDRDIQVIRGIEDGEYVFLHVTQSLNGGSAKWITTDMFHFDEDDQIIEHWDVIAEWVDETVSGRSQFDGATEVVDLDRTEANRALVTAFIDDVLVGGNGQNAASYVSTETYLQHNPAVGDGLEGLGAYLGQLAEAGAPMVYKYVHRILAQGNFVVAYSLMQMGDEDYAVFDIFRVEDGKIVEHWDNMEPLPRGEMLVNQGKF
ncbi:MAG: nuclear transport factor 2 family protein [Actinomycetota bacterium]